MLHRSLVTDDEKGLGQPVEEKQPARMSFNLRWQHNDIAPGVEVREPLAPVTASDGQCYPTCYGQWQRWSVPVSAALFTISDARYNL